MARREAISRRRVLTGIGSLVTSGAGIRTAGGEAPLRFALTPVLLTSDLAMLEELKGYLEAAMGRPVHLVTRRTYQEITALLVSRQVEAAWICGYPFVAYRDELALVAVPVWQGRPLYRSYLSAGSTRRRRRSPISRAPFTLSPIPTATPATW